MKFGLLFLLQDPPNGEHIPRLYDEVFEQDEWTFTRVAPNRLICGTPDEVVADIKRYEREIGCQYMILMLRHPTGPSHQETLQCIERLGSKVLPQCR